METSARALVDHWGWAANKGLMNRNTAGGLRSACAGVLEVMGDGWEQTDISSVDVEDLLLRFQNLKKKDYRPEVLEVYKQRFRKAVVSYMEYLANPGSWKPGAREKSTPSQRSERPPKHQPTASAVAAVAVSHNASPDAVEYPFPLRPGIMARLILPRDLTKDDVTRLSAFMAMLVVGTEQRKPIEGGADGR
jgi:hypothetical protein